MRRYFVLLSLLLVLLLSSCVSLPWSSDRSTSSLPADQNTISELINDNASCSSDQTTAPLTKMGFAIQVGAFSQLDNAVRFKQMLQLRGVDAYHFLHKSGLYKVRFGNHENYPLARREAERLQRQGLIDRFFIVNPEYYAVAQVSQTGQRGLREELVKTAQSFLGVPYRWGGEDRKNGFDCSGLMMVSYRNNGLYLPRNSRVQNQAGRSVAKKQLQKGDLVFFATQGGTRVTHVGMYAGNNRFIHAPRTGKTVRFANLSNEFWQESYVGGRTYL